MTHSPRVPRRRRRRSHSTAAPQEAVASQVLAESRLKREQARRLTVAERYYRWMFLSVVIFLAGYLVWRG